MQSILTGSLWLAGRCRHCRRQLSSIVDANAAIDVTRTSSSTSGLDLTDAVNALSRCRRRTSSPRAAVSSIARRLAFKSSPTNASGLFGIPELRDSPPEVGFRHLQLQAQETVASLLAEALPSDDAQRRRPMVRILDDMSDAVCRVADMADCVRQLHPSPGHRAAAEAACVAIATLVESLNTNRRLYERLVLAVRDRGQGGDAARFDTDEVDTRVGDLLIWDFHQSGVHLADSAAGQRFVALSERAFVLGAEFARGAMQPAPAGGGRSRGPLLDAAGDHPDPRVRRAAYAAFHAEMPQQEAILLNLLNTRREIARLAGFPTFADRANAGCLLESAESVGRFLSGLADRLAPRVALDAGVMRQLSGGGSAEPPPGAWDFVHMVNAATAACFRGEHSAVAGSSLEEFFSVGACLRGVAHVAECLFGVRLELAASNGGEPGGELWDDRVFKLKAWRRGDCDRAVDLGYIYCDFFPRQGKPAQDCHFTIRGGRQGPPRQQPVVCLQLQCPDPPAHGSSAPALLSPCHVENLFHEFGHALHSVLGCTRYQHVTGTRCSTDLAEVPSTLFEMFAFQPCVLRHYARHWRTGEALPERLFASLRASRRVLPAASRQQQVLYSQLDLRLHSDPGVTSTTEVFHQLAGTSAMRHLPAYPRGTAWHHRFTHLVGYGAKYHAYLVSKAVASLVWSTRFARDPLCSAAGGDLERRLLARGGEAATVAMVTELTGRPATVDSLADSLLADVVECQEGKA